MATSNFRALALSLSVILSACGGGGDSSPSEPLYAQASKACTVVTVALLGDSTQWGADGLASDKVPSNPAVVLQAEMNARFGIGGVVVTSYAVGGTTSAQAPTVAADIVVANYGINDAAPWGESIDAYKANLEAMPATLFETPNPTPGYPWNIGEYAQTMRDVAASRSMPVADVYTYVKNLPSYEGYFADGIHPSNELYPMIVKNVLAPAVATLVQQTRRCG